MNAYLSHFTALYALCPNTGQAYPVAVGIITDIDNLQMARIARLAGAPMDPGARVDLHRKLGDEVRQGDLLYTIHAVFDADFRFASEAAEIESGYRIEAAGSKSL